MEKSCTGKEIGSGAFGTVYAIEEGYNHQQKQTMIEQKKQRAEIEAHILYELKDCLNIVQYEAQIMKEHTRN